MTLEDVLKMMDGSPSRFAVCELGLLSASKISESAASLSAILPQELLVNQTISSTGNTTLPEILRQYCLFMILFSAIL